MNLVKTICLVVLAVVVSVFVTRRLPQHVYITTSTDMETDLLDEILNIFQASPASEKKKIGLDVLEEQLLKRALQRCNDNQSAAARLLGITRYALRYRMEKFLLPTKSVSQGTTGTPNT